MKKRWMLLIFGILICFDCLAISRIDAAEYYWDLDPGNGNGILILGDGFHNMNFAIGSENLQPGVHQLYLRARNEDGVWGIPRSRTVYKPFSDNPELPVTALEYFFDADPGEGSASVLQSRTYVDLDALLDTAQLAPGIHQLYLRARNEDGVWGIPRSRTVYKPFSDNPELTVTALEYFFDTDPGEGNGTSLVNRFSLELSSMLGIEHLEAGVHKLYVRAKDASGTWGLPQHRIFIIMPITSDISNRLINRLEYFFDIDPGFGNGIGCDYAPGDSLETNIAVNTGGLNNGLHRLYVRARDVQGRWGIPRGFSFVKGTPANVCISIVGGNIILSWDPVDGATDYDVYTSSSPESGFAEDESGTFGENSWIAQELGERKFFYIKAVFAE